MKKVALIGLAIATTIIISSSANAQKIGSFDEESVLGLMPGIGKVDTLLQRYVQDSLNVRRDYEMSELKRKDSTYKADSSKMSGSLRDIMQKEISQHFYTIQNWQQIQNQALQGRQEELLRPFRQKVYAALQDIITEQKYVYVLKSEVFFAPVPLGDNLSIKVAQKLKLPLPKEVEDALKAQGLSTGSPIAPSKPAGGGARPGAKGRN